jgi:hypothetical protein
MHRIDTVHEQWGLSCGRTFGIGCQDTGEVTVAAITNLAELARALAEIASQTADADTAKRLMALVDRLMTEAGVPLASDQAPRSPNRG